MSDRDKENKHNRDQHISGSMYARVNVGNNVNNSHQGSRQSNIAGSMNNPDEKNTGTHKRSFLYSALFYILGIVFAFIYMYISLWIFKDYFDSPESKAILPSTASILVPFLLGFSSSKLLLYLFGKKL
ncbi:hypothetical protein [Marinilactibacillus kalidii]|uniref:hypothetical protein n=1 Tax=Marinilactibacillus kalidii TaxID=2820274 RepID=UPI001ABDBC94|nr:hypothetical protein [Marinilactibacillus kalidii]